MWIVMEHTGLYWRPVASVLQRGGFFISVVNATEMFRIDE